MQRWLTCFLVVGLLALSTLAETDIATNLQIHWKMDEGTGTTHDAHVFDMNFSGQCIRNGDAVAAWAITSGTCAAGAHGYLHGLVDAGSTTFTPMSEGKILGAKLEYTAYGTE